MSKKRVEKYIPKALQVLDATFKDKDGDGEIPSAYNGYISSFGASIMQSGLKPTLALFENTKANTKETRKPLNEIILKILDDTTDERSLLRYVLQSKKDEQYIKEQILDISIAIKLSIRTFKLVDGKKDA